MKVLHKNERMKNDRKRIQMKEKHNSVQNARDGNEDEE